jgi:DNA-binding HxlR family transcriptional regulator
MSSRPCRSLTSLSGQAGGLDPVGRRHAIALLPRRPYFPSARPSASIVGHCCSVAPLNVVRLVQIMNYFPMHASATLNPMHRYGQYCPVARAAEVLADRWTVLIVRELLADINHFNELERGLPHMSRGLLAERLRRLERNGVLERRAASRGKRTEYRLTLAGRELQRLIDILGEWGACWGVRRSATERARPDSPSVVDAPTCCIRFQGLRWIEWVIFGTGCLTKLCIA